MTEDMPVSESFGASNQALLGGLVQKNNTTVAENIDRKISEMHRQIERLEHLKRSLSEPGGILNVSIQDLRFAMNY